MAVAAVVAVVERGLDLAKKNNVLVWCGVAWCGVVCGSTTPRTDM